MPFLIGLNRCLFWLPLGQGHLSAFNRGCIAELVKKMAYSSFGVGIFGRKLGRLPHKKDPKKTPLGFKFKKGNGQKTKPV